MSAFCLTADIAQREVCQIIALYHFVDRETEAPTAPAAGSTNFSGARAAHLQPKALFSVPPTPPYGAKSRAREASLQKTRTPRLGWSLKLLLRTNHKGLPWWSRLRAPNAGGPGSIPGRGTRSHTHAAAKTSHAATKSLHATAKTRHSQINK